ncbi:unnamed protein product, partial [marine sediment metagenome]
AFEFWFEHHSKRHKKTWREDRRKFNNDLGPLHNRKLRDLTKDDIRRLHSRWAKTKGEVTANRLLSLVKAVINFAVKEGKYTGADPAVHVSKFKESSRQRYVTRGEMASLLAAIDEEASLFRDYFLVLLCTGARRSNVATMRWSDVDLDDGLWTVPETKQGESHFVTLAPQVIEILERRRDRLHGLWAFPSPRDPRKALSDPRKAWARVLKSAGLSDLRMHDLRRTLGSWQAAAGASELIIGKSLGHADGSKATHIYARLNLDRFARVFRMRSI